MPSHAAFLRAINLGRNRRVSGAELRELFEGVGFDDVASFRTSGNVVFEADRGAAGELGARIKKQLEAALGYAVGVFLRGASEVRAIAAAEPFEAAAVEASKGKLQVALLARKPAAGARKQVEALATEQDRLSFEGRELYWLPSGGYMESALDGAAFEELLGPLTVRTKGTVELLASKYFGE